MNAFPLKHPRPDFEAMAAVLRGDRAPTKVHFVEEFVDPEVINYITQNLLEEDFPVFDESSASVGSNAHRAAKVERFAAGGDLPLLDGELDELRLRRDVNFYHRMGYDYVPDLAPWSSMGGMITACAASIGKAKAARKATDTATAAVSRGKRVWVEEDVSVIRSWEDFERYPWERIQIDKLGIDTYYAYAKTVLPDGMVLPAVGCLFNPGVMGKFFGFEDLCYFLYEQPDLVKAVVDKVGQLNYDLYAAMIPHACVGFMWHADDLGWKLQTLLSPDQLRTYVLPWFKRYAALAHEHGKQFWLHSCGQVYDLMEDLIEDVGVDAKHSFEDEILPVTEFVRRYGDRCAALGGVDMDKLCRLQGDALRDYLTAVLDACMPGGRYAFGTGNTVANYVPLENYFTMMEVGLRYL